MVDMVIKNGLVITPNGTIRGGLAVQDGRILQVGPDAALPDSKNEIDAGGLIVFPGLIDPHTHMGQPRDEASFEKDIGTESVACAVAGVTTMITTFFLKQFDSQTVLPRYNTVKEMAKRASLVDYKMTPMVLTDGVVSEIPELVKQSVTSFKFPLFYAGPQGEFYGMPKFDLGFVYKAFEAIAKVGPPALAMIHAEESSIYAVMKERLQAAGRNDGRAWSEASPNICEAMHVFACGLMAMEVDAPLYVVHTSTKESVDAINYLKSKGCTIYGETCPHYLSLTRDNDFGIFCKMSPPLRGEADIERLWQGIREGVIVTIGTDHGVHYRKTKEEGGIWSGRAGFPVMGTTIPIMISEGIKKNRITFEEMAKLCAENTARLFGMYPKKGVLAPGSDADIVIIDPDKEWTLSLKAQKVGSDFSIWEGRKVKGKPVKTFVRGKLVAEDGEPVAKAPWGKLAVED